MYFWALIGWILLLHFYLFPLSLFGIEERPYLTKIGRDTMGFKTSLDWPEGGWQKGATTTLLMETWVLYKSSMLNSLSFFKLTYNCNLT